MGALELDRMTWADVKAEQDAGRDQVIVAFDATEQHGRDAAGHRRADR